MKRLLGILLVLVIGISVIACGAPATTTAVPTATLTTVPVPAASTTAPITAKTTTAIPGTTAPKPTSASAVVKGGTLIYLDSTTAAGPIGLPWFNREQYAGTKLTTEAVMGSLIDGTLTPALCTSFDVSSDPADPSLTFHLRKGVKFHDGTDWNAQAYAWNLQKFKEGGLLVASRYTKSTEILDDYTVRLHLTMWRNSILPAFEMAPMASPTAFEKNGEDWMRRNIVGTGPFKLTTFSQDVKFIAGRSDNYWAGDGKPYLDQVQYLNVADELTRLALFKSGTGDMMNLAKNGRVATELMAQGYQVYTQISGTLSLMPDSGNATSAWSNIKVRQAAEYAIDKAAIAKTFGFGFSTAADQWYPKGMLPYDPSIPGRKYDVAKAKTLLTEAGYPNGFKTKIIGDPTVNKDIVVALQAYLSAVGIAATLEFPEASKFSTYSLGTWDNALLCTILRTSPQPTQGISFTAEPRVQYKSNKNPADWMSYYNHIMTTKEVDQKVIWEGFKAMYDDVMVITVMYLYDMMAVTNRVQDHNGGTYGSFQTWNVGGAWLKK